jgi:hypothetical protein
MVGAVAYSRTGVPGGAATRWRRTSTVASRDRALFQEAGVVDDQHTARLPELLGDVLLHVVTHLVRTPACTVQQILKARRSAVAYVLGQLPAVLPAHRAEQAVDVGPHLPPQVHPPEPVTDPNKCLFQFRRPDVGPHILHDNHNGPPRWRLGTSGT